MVDGVVPSESAFREIRRMYWETKRMHRNLVTRLSSVSTRRHQGGERLPARVKFLNNSSETVPAWGLMRITGGSSKDYLTIDKPDATYRWLYLVNGPSKVATGKPGFGSFLTSESFSFKRNRVLYDTGNTPAYGERWGPKADSWLLWQHRPGFWILGGTTGSGATARVIALQIPPGEVRVQNDDGSGSLAAGGGPRTFGIYGGSAGTADTGLEVALYNGSSTAWAATKYGFATADAGGLVWGAPHQT